MEGLTLSRRFGATYWQSARCESRADFIAEVFRQIDRTNRLTAEINRRNSNGRRFILPAVSTRKDS